MAPQDQAIDNLVALFEDHATRIVGQAQRETLRTLLDRLSVTDGVIDRTKSNVRLLHTVGDMFTKNMRKAGYDVLVSEFIEAFNGQFVYFDAVLEDLGRSIGRDLRITFGERDKSLFLQQQMAAKDMLHQAVEIQAKAAQQQAMFSVGAVRAADLTKLIAEKLDITSGRASALADTSLSTFYRTIADRGYQQVEAQLGKGILLLYKYGGPSDKLTRRVCREWLAMTAEKGITREEINGLSNGQLPNAFVTCGGFRCRHQWIAKAQVKDKERKVRAAKPVDPASDFLTRDEYKRFKRVRDAFGDKLEITGWDNPQVQDHVRDLSYMPDYAAKHMAAKGTRLKLGVGSVADFPENADLASTQPRGWSQGRTWKDVMGAYRQSTNVAYAGTGPHGSVSAVLHEAGHGLAYMQAWEFDFFGRGRDMVSHHTRLFNKGRLIEYLKQDGPGGNAGRSELWAEGLATFWKHGYNKTAQVYDKDFAGFLRDTMKELKNKQVLTPNT